jgi:hypothetical protein
MTSQKKYRILLACNGYYSLAYDRAPTIACSLSNLQWFAFYFISHTLVLAFLLTTNLLPGLADFITEETNQIFLFISVIYIVLNFLKKCLIFSPT